LNDIFVSRAIRADSTTFRRLGPRGLTVWAGRRCDASGHRTRRFFYRDRIRQGLDHNAIKPTNHPAALSTVNPNVEGARSRRWLAGRDSSRAIAEDMKGRCRFRLPKALPARHREMRVMEDLFVLLGSVLIWGRDPGSIGGPVVSSNRVDPVQSFMMASYSGAL